MLSYVVFPTRPPDVPMEWTHVELVVERNPDSFIPSEITHSTEHGSWKLETVVGCDAASLNFVSSWGRLATITLGVCPGGLNWTCTFDDLTIAGRALYRLLQSLYEGHEILLVTYATPVP